MVVWRVERMVVMMAVMMVHSLADLLAGSWVAKSVESMVVWKADKTAVQMVE